MNLRQSNYKKHIIAITGMMGSGKTTIGQNLAKKLDYFFFDSDVEIEDFTKKKISDIFIKEGEGYFRTIEEDIIEKLIMRDENMVISLGGGAFISEKTRKLLKKNATTFCLDANIETIIMRTKNASARPLLNVKNKRLAIENLLKKRKKFYDQADFIIDSNANNHGKIIKSILENLFEKC